MSHYDIHVGDVIKYPEMVMARTEKKNESANDRTINLFSPRIKISLQMSGVKDSQGLYSFSLHRKVIEFCSICQLLQSN